MKRNNSREARNITDHQPFCWQEKKALDKIRRSFDGEISSALLTYVALTEIASDLKAETFPASASYIASKAGLTRKTVMRRVEPLEKCGLIAVKRTKIPGSKQNATNQYTLLKVGVGTLSPYGQREGVSLSQNRRIKNKEHVLRTNTFSSKKNTPNGKTHVSRFAKTRPLLKRKGTERK
jgi:hypothetical protein